MVCMRSFSGLPGNAWRALTGSDNEAEQGLPLWLGVLLWVVLFAGLILLVFLLAH
jgi:hypothetical protein